MTHLLCDSRMSEAGVRQLFAYKELIMYGTFG